MATFRAYQSVDMLDFGQRADTADQVTDRMAFLEVGDGHWYLYGDFKDPDGDWRGTINGLRIFDLSGDLVAESFRLDLDARHVSVGATAAFATRSAYAKDDLIVGSRAADRLAGFSGDDVIRGGAGRDTLFGNDGDDALSGGSGRDRLHGGVGADILAGGSGDDTLRGDAGADVFVFNARGGRDVVRDFVDGEDRLRILSGTERFRDLEISELDGDVTVAFARAEIVLRGGDAEAIGPGDFLFA